MSKAAPKGGNPPPKKPRKAFDHYVLECFKQIDKDEPVDLSEVCVFCKHTSSRENTACAHCTPRIVHQALPPATSRCSILPSLALSASCRHPLLTQPSSLSCLGTL